MNHEPNGSHSNTDYIEIVPGGCPHRRRKELVTMTDNVKKHQMMEFLVVGHPSKRIEAVLVAQRSMLIFPLFWQL